MGNGAAAIQARAVVDYTKPKIIWRRDGSDIELIKSLFRAEEDELLREKHSQHEIDIYMKIYMKGVMQMRDGMIDLIKQDLIPAVFLSYLLLVMTRMTSIFLYFTE